MSDADVSDVIDAVKRAEHRSTGCSDDHERTTTNRLGLLQLHL